MLVSFQEGDMAGLTTAEIKRKVHKVFDQFNNREIFSDYGKLYAANVVNHFPDGKETKGLDLTLFKQMVAAFPDLRLTLDSIVVEGNQEAHRYTWSGTFKASFMNIQPTGNRITVPESVVFQTWRRGKIAEIWWMTNDQSMLRQMGAIPAPPRS
jgi:predicted ester cyclase